MPMNLGVLLAYSGAYWRIVVRIVVRILVHFAVISYINESQTML